MLQNVQINKLQFAHFAVILVLFVREYIVISRNHWSRKW